jgi:hypothetical protein
MRYSSAILALPLCLSAGIAAATPATPEGAADLVKVLQTYLGATDGVVSVAPEGEVYGVKLDFAPLIAKAPKDAGIEITLTPIEFTLTDNGDGTWGMTEDQALGLTMKVPGALDLSVQVANLTGSGTFDEALNSFSTSSTAITGMTVAQKVTDPANVQTAVAYAVDSLRYESTAKANAVAGVDLVTTYAGNGLVETLALPGLDGAGAAAEMVTVKAETFTGDGAITALRPDAMYKLLAFFVANPEEAAIIAQQDGLKTILKDGLPLFEHMQSKSSVLNTTADTSTGQFGLAEMAIEVEIGGIVADGMLREAFGLTGLTMPEGLVPDWAVDLVPQSLSLDFKVAGFDLAAPAAMLLQVVDFAKPDAMTPEQQTALMAALLPNGTLEFTMAPSAIIGPIYALTYDGTVSVPINSAPTAEAAPAMPTGKATITATGLDAVKQALQAAPAEISGQATQMFAIAESMAKPGTDGALMWEFETSPQTGVSVNGNVLVPPTAP